jgi:hypothetical protein
VNKEELNWLLETIQDARTAQRFVSAQYERGRISSQVMAGVARGTRLDQSHRESTLGHGDASLNRIRGDGTTSCYCLIGAGACPRKVWRATTGKERASRPGDALKRCEADNITLKNCPAYIREWITRERKTREQ